MSNNKGQNSTAKKTSTKGKTNHVAAPNSADLTSNKMPKDTTQTPVNTTQKTITQDSQNDAVTDESSSTAQPASKPDTPSDNDMSRKNRKNTQVNQAAKPANTPKNANQANTDTPVKQDNTPQTADKAAAEVTKKPTEPTKPVDTTQKKPDNKPDNKAEKPVDKPTEKQSEQSPEPTAKSTAKSTAKPAQPAGNPPAEPKKSGGIVPKAALLLGVIGTGIGVYDYDQIRTLKSQDNTVELVTRLNAAEAKITELSARNTDALEQKISTLSGDIETFKSAAARVNERLSAIEQTQAGLSKTLQGDLNKTLDTRLNEVNALLQKIKQIELTQEGLSKNLSQVTAAGEAVTATGMAKQEVGYLLRMADYKIASEGDTVGSAGLLKIAEDKLLLINKGQVTPLISAIRQKLTQLAGVQPIDPDAIIRDLKALSRAIPNLVAKTNTQAADSSEADMKKAATESDKGILGSIGAVIASGVKYTPNDPSKIDISAETVLIEKRLMQADIRTAELAVRSQNQVLLAESLRSVRNSLDKYFAKDATATAIGKTLTDIEQRKLETVLPDLSTLVKQFEGRQ